MNPSRPKKSLGQNFLVDLNVARKIVDRLEPGPADQVVEIGPGKGVLTRLLAGKAGSILALEKDRKLAFDLEKYPGVQVINMDALQVDWSRLDRMPGVKIIGNLPYNIAQVLLWDLAAGCRGFSRAVVMVQKEAAQRIAAAPGGRQYGALSVWIQSFTVPRVLFKVPPGVFRPRPRVESAVIELRPRLQDKFFFVPEHLSKLTRILFQNRRKQLGKIIKTYWNNKTKFVFHRSGLDPTTRPEQLSPEQLQGLSRLIF
ncbi:16S rRNA (adenine(1518)-N(6)/adenine(1519)-N(6))-dimethyltransferase RsmA [Desulfonatronospira sp.]|uniref:16S rRNA (adenine(1518)-N(6)/adenine(1519)-N(6))- dimethyltransferase RsmA n=1 Tax=Desulfonatronospira sp. TaxID=1962951 RepID=UPI0025B8F5B4|nr:16S rRNA (adenine(1518)-N(6)/adenine(1519)-N(6))-dimethyltransferase RsmA [Desulfonatronospira sp.]